MKKVLNLVLDGQFLIPTDEVLLDNIKPDRF